MSDDTVMQIRFILPTLFFLFLALASMPAVAIDTTAKQAIVIDYDTGAVLYEMNADERMPTSSMSKVMTMSLVFDALKNGHLKLDDTLTVSEKAWSKQGSKMFVNVGSQVKVEDLIRGVVIQSGNDATIVLAEGLAGTEEAFAEALNKKAESIGMMNSNFKNASGWPDPDHYSTARDLATLARYEISTYPDFYKYYAEEEFTYNDIKQGNRNPLLYRGIGADGVKTGHTEDGGYGLIGSAVRNDRRVIVVLNGMESVNERANESAKLLGWGLAGFENKEIFTPGTEIQKANVIYGVEPQVGVTVSEKIIMTVPKLEDKPWEQDISIDETVEAPIKKGQKVGTLKVSVDGQDPVTRDLVATQDVARLNWFWLIIEKIRMLLLGP
ncbi:MAG: D-alanyl-D-alanine carboxypeptidase [Micavibrio sp.]|nr:D-alanyl-D-alanine carboxypeptidase [Micavibrio sp.]